LTEGLRGEQPVYRGDEGSPHVNEGGRRLTFKGLRSPNKFDRMGATMYRRGLRLPPSKEEKVAVAIGKLLSDFSLDLEAIGKYLATSQPYVVYARALEVLEATEYNKTTAEYREQGKYYGDGLW
jgi:hypothetical protein